MRENSDNNTYDAEARIDELLNSYMDGELTTSQNTEVEDLLARDDGIAQRLRQLQKCRTLLGALPCVEAPPKILEGVKATLAERALQVERPISDRVRQMKYPRVRRVLAAAAMIGLAAVLTTVTRTMFTPQTPSEQPFTNVLTPREFSGTLELKTSDVIAVSASVNKALEDIHLSEAIKPASRQERRIYTLSCSKADARSLLADLEPVWPELDSATLRVNTDVFGERIVVEAVTTEQVAKIIEQDHSGKRIEMARELAALNHMDSLLPDRAIANAIEGQNDDTIPRWQAPKPILTEPEDPIVKKSTQPEDKETVHLTIVVSW